MYCPKCKQQTLVPYMGWNFGTHLCKTCGYIGPLFIEDVPKKMIKEPKLIREPKYYRQEFKGMLVNFYDLSFRVVLLGQEKKMRERFLKHISTEMKTILDMATGTGSVAIAIKLAFPKISVTGIDLSEEMLHIAEKKAQKQHSRISFLLQNIEKTQFKKEAFDAITLSFGLHELPLENRKNVLKEAYRLLKKGGKFLIMDYHRPRSKLFSFFLNIHIFLVEKYAKTILNQDLQKELQKYGFHKTKKELIYGDLVQIIVGEK